MHPPKAAIPAGQAFSCMDAREPSVISELADTRCGVYDLPLRFLRGVGSGTLDAVAGGCMDSLAASALNEIALPHH